MNKLYVLYVPGLGNKKPRLQQAVVKLWQLWGVEAELIYINWADSVAWPIKFERLLQRIDTLSDNHSVALIGASAGATAVINAYEARRNLIVGCVIIAGKANHAETIGKFYRDKYPSFITSAYDCQSALNRLGTTERKRILSIYGLADQTVAKQDSHIQGAYNRVSPTILHSLTIAIQLTVGAPFFLAFLKKVLKQSY